MYRKQKFKTKTDTYQKQNKSDKVSQITTVIQNESNLAKQDRVVRI
jgi:hypothetical protein